MTASSLCSGPGPHWLLGFSCGFSWMMQLGPAVAQPIVPDPLLPGFASPSQVNPVTSILGCSSNCFELTGGVRQGDNLFHSFSTFDVPSQGAALFRHSSLIESIFARVTGGQVSQIDGLLGTDGASLYLLNSNGILFGPNARLDVANIFVAGTGRRFIARPNSLDLGLLSTDITEPVRLFSYGVDEVRMQFEGATGAGIAVLGDASQPLLNPNGGFGLGLLSGDIAIRDRSITVPTQQLVLGGFKDGGDVLLNRVQTQLGESAIAENVADVVIERSVLQSSGAVTNGEIRIHAFDLEIRDSALQTLTSPSTPINEPLSPRNPIQGDVRLFVEDGAIALTNSTIEALALPGAASGEIRLAAANDVTLDNSRLAVSTAGNWGQIVAPDISGQLRLRNGSVIEAIAKGNPAFTVGKVDLTAAEISLETGSRIATQSSVVDAPLGTGNISLNLQEQLSLTGGSELSVGPGPGATSAAVGNLAVRASRITLDGASTIRADAQASGGNILLRSDVLGLGSGSLVRSESQALGGNINVLGTDIALTDQAAIQTFSQAQGGNVFLNGTNLSLSNQSSIVTDTLGRGGNIALTLDQQLGFVGKALIQATATEPGAGNIRIEAAMVNSSRMTDADILYAGINDPSRLTLNLQSGAEFFNRLTERDRFPQGDGISQIGFRIDKLPEISALPAPGFSPPNPTVPPPKTAPAPNSEPVLPMFVLNLALSEEEAELSLGSSDGKQRVRHSSCGRVAPDGSLTLRGRGGVAASPERFAWPQSLADLGQAEVLANGNADVAAKFRPEASQFALPSRPNQSIEASKETRITPVEAMGWKRDRQGKITLIQPRQLAMASPSLCSIANAWQSF